MRYPDGGGLTAAGRARRQSVRLQAARMYEQDVSPVQVAHGLRVSTKSAYQWRRRWRAGGEAALASKGAGGAVCRLNDGQVARLRAALEGGPAALGWDQDQRWTLARVTEVIWRRFRVEYTLAGADLLLHRIGWSAQFPARQAAERDEARIATWRQEVWPVVKGPRRTWAPG